MDRSLSVRSGFLASLSLSLCLASFGPLQAQSEFGGIIADSTRDDFRRSLVRVSFSYPVRVKYRDRYVSAQANEVAEITGMVIDSGGYIAALADGFFIDEKNLDGLHVGVSLDGRKISARIVGVDQRIDLVLLHSHQLTGRALPIAESLKTGLWHFASDQDGSWSVSSFEGRLARRRKGLPTRDLRLVGVSETDYRRLPGSLAFNPLGEFLGFVLRQHKYFPKKRQAEFILLPHHIVEESAQRMKREGNLTSGWLGVTLDFNRASGSILVTHVWPNNPAELAGIRAGDLIQQIGGVTPQIPEEVGLAVRWTGSGNPIRIVVQREGRIRRFKAVLDRPPRNSVWVAENRPAEKGGESRVFLYKTSLTLPHDFGLTLQSLTGRRREELKVPVTEGLIVTGVRQGTAAEMVFKVGDVIHKVNGVVTCCMTELGQALSALPKQRRVFVEFYRDAHLKTVEVHIK